MKRAFYLVLIITLFFFFVLSPAHKANAIPIMGMDELRRGYRKILDEISERPTGLFGISASTQTGRQWRQGRKESLFAGHPLGEGAAEE